jgi:hypothetical protein
MTTGQLAHAKRQMQRRIRSVLAQRRLDVSTGVQKTPEHSDSTEPAPED